MQYRNLGKWGLKVSEISLGSWMTELNGLGAAETARQCIRAAYDAGVNFFDCADAYSGGEAEKFLGAALRVLEQVAGVFLGAADLLFLSVFAVTVAGERAQRAAQHQSQRDP